MLPQYCWGSAAQGGKDSLLIKYLEDCPVKVLWDIFLIFWFYFCFSFSVWIDWCNICIERVKLPVRVEISARSWKRASWGHSIFQTKRQCLWKQGWMDQWMILLRWRDQKSLKFVNHFNGSNCCSNKLQSIKVLKVNSDFWSDYHSSQQKHLKIFCIGRIKRNNPDATIINQFKTEILKAPFQVLWLRTTCLTGKAKLWKSVISGHYT